MTGREDLRVKAVGTDMDDLTRIAQDTHALGIEIEDEVMIHREYFRPYAPFGHDETKAGSPVSGVTELGGNADVVEIRIGEEAPVAGKTLREAGEDGLVAPDVLVVTIERDGQAITPKGETTVEAGDFVTVLTRSRIADATLKAFIDEQNPEVD